MTVSNSTVLISLAKIGRADLLKNIFKNVIITETIKQELTERQESYKNEVLIFNELLSDKFIIVKDPKQLKNFELDEGETSCLSLCEETNDNVFLSDDKDARDVANSMGINAIGTLGILILNLEKNKIGKKEFFEILKELIDRGFYISAELFAFVEDYVQKNF